MKKLLRPIHKRAAWNKPTLPVYVFSLGCPKNRADTENFLGSLGVPVETVANPARARLVFINTCAFIEPATRESLRAILDTAKSIRRLRSKPLLAVAGCLPGRYGIETLKRQIPEVDIWLDFKQQAQWPALVGRALKFEPAEKPARLFSSPAHAWLKIAEGCQHNCAFCAIPKIRGPLRSRPLTEIAGEARAALAHGIKEIDLVAQDVTAWGRDLALGESRSRLPSLVRTLASLPGLAWLRLLYLYPGSLDDELLMCMAEGGPILPYLDIPFQHCEPKMLARMGRGFTGDPEALIDRIRTFLPDAALRATFMTGFPGETDRDFSKLCAFVRKTRFTSLGVFVFQPEEGVRASNMPDQVPRKIAEERKNELMAIQAEISREFLAAHVGSRMEVLVDRDEESAWPGLHAGRVWFQAPEIDGITYVSGHGVEPGAMLEAEIVDSQAYDLSALAECP